MFEIEKYRRDKRQILIYNHRITRSTDPNKLPINLNTLFVVSFEWFFLIRVAAPLFAQTNILHFVTSTFELLFSSFASYTDEVIVAAKFTVISAINCSAFCSDLFGFDIFKCPVISKEYKQANGRAKQSNSRFGT